MKGNTKYILLLLLLNSACQSRASKEFEGQSAKETNLDLTKNIRVTVPMNVCLDTLELNRLDISYWLNDDNKEWVLSTRSNFEEKNVRSITYFYSARSQCKKPTDYFTTDSLRIAINPTLSQTIQVDKFESSSSFSNLANPNSRLIDINFDGHMDIDLALNDRSGVTNELRQYFIFNPTKGSFEKGLTLANLSIDTTLHLLYTSWSAGHAGNISTRIWSRIKNYQELQTVKKIKSSYHKALDSYIVETTELYGEGDYSLKIDTIKA